MRRIIANDTDTDFPDPDAGPAADPLPPMPPVLTETIAYGAPNSAVMLSSITTGTNAAHNAGSIAGQVMVPPGGVLAPINDNDFIAGTENADTIDAGAGNDFVYGAGGDDDIQGGLGHDTLAGGAGHDTIDGGEGVDWLLGEAGNDKLFGGRGTDKLRGGDGDDELNGGRDADVLTGGAGHDKFIVGQSQGVGAYGTMPVDTITDFTTSGINADTIGLRSALLGTKFFLYNDPYAAKIQDAFSQGYVSLATHGTPGQPGHGTTIWIDSNGSLAGGEVYAVAEINGVSASNLTVQHGHFFFL